MKTKNAEFHLPIYKRGNDLRECLKHVKGNKCKGLILYAQQLHFAATLCEDLAAELKGKRNVEIEADTHYISIEGPDAWIDKMVEMELLDEAVEEHELP